MKAAGDTFAPALVPALRQDEQATANKIDADFGCLDILVNNAGMIADSDGPASVSSSEAIERALRVNFVGTVAVTQAMLPLLRKSQAAQIINVSSGLGSIARNAAPQWESRYTLLGYCSSKAAMSMFTVQLAVELKDAGIAVNSVNPGYTATDINENRGHQTLQEGTAEIVRLAQLQNGPTGGFFETGASLPW